MVTTVTIVIQAYMPKPKKVNASIFPYNNSRIGGNTHAKKRKIISE